MPTYLLSKGFRFFFYSNENNEPVHVHITKGEAYGKVWLEPKISIDYMVKFSKSDEKDIIDIISKNADNFKTKWNEYFGK